jgi:hypothetical protein
MKATSKTPVGIELFISAHFLVLILVDDLYISLYAFHLGQIISTDLGQVDHDGQHVNAAGTPIPDKTSETNHTQKRRFRHSAIYRTIKAYKRHANQQRS